MFCKSEGTDCCPANAECFTELAECTTEVAEGFTGVVQSYRNATAERDTELFCEDIDIELSDV